MENPTGYIIYMAGITLGCGGGQGGQHEGVNTHQWWSEGKSVHVSGGSCFR